MEKRYAISDIHGNAYAFLKLLDHVDPDPEELVILGDLGDRGLDTWGVFEECEQLIDEGTDIVIGNHDHWLKLVRSGQMSTFQFSQDQIGGLTTLRSIEIAIKKHGNDHVDKTIGNVLSSMKPYVETDELIFVHAGIDPRIHYMDQQKPEILMMGCGEWKNPRVEHSFEQMIVFGHVPTPSIHKAITENDAKIWSNNRARKCAIDTGGGFGMRLTLADFKEGIAYAYDFSKREIIEYQFRRPMR